MNWSKDTIRKPRLYIATHLQGFKAKHSALDLALSLDINPFISSIFAIEGAFELAALDSFPDASYREIATTMTSELELADIVVVDMRNGEPPELGYAVAKEKPVVLFNPEEVKLSPVGHGKPCVEVHNEAEFVNINFLNIMLQK